MALRLVESEPAEFELTDARSKRPRPGRFSWWAILIVLGLVGIALFPWGWRNWVEWRYAPVTYSAEEYLATPASAESVPSVAPRIAPRIAIVFGARVYSNERLSAMLRDRVDTAIDLYHAGKVDMLLLSGGQNGLEYDEPGAMMAHALERGVPAEAIQPDYGGRRTYDSCYRAAHIFQVEQAVLVTQEFHLPRALLLCDNLGIQVVGVKADRRDYAPRSIAWSESREIPALLAALVDLVRRPLPPILGEPIPLE
ncbi:MAG: YdcF family protein [Caldilineaceae bacterium]|nr:YdcF family protein [Caldilineaceae bacterium]